MSNTLRAVVLLLGSQQVEQQGAEPGVVEHVGDVAVARAVPAAAAAVGEHHDAGRRAGGTRRCPVDRHPTSRDDDVLVACRGPASRRPRRRRSEPAVGLLQQRDDLVVGRRREVLVVRAHGPEVRAAPTRTRPSSRLRQLRQRCPPGRPDGQDDPRGARAAGPPGTRPVPSTRWRSRRRRRPRSGRAGRPAGRPRRNRSTRASRIGALAALDRLELLVGDPGARHHARGRAPARRPRRWRPWPARAGRARPSLRTTMTSSGAPSASATSDATGTPPRGSPSTTTSSPRRKSSFPTRCRPASSRSSNTSMVASLGSDTERRKRRSRDGTAGRRLRVSPTIVTGCPGPGQRPCPGGSPGPGAVTASLPDTHGPAGSRGGA